MMTVSHIGAFAAGFLTMLILAVVLLLQVERMHRTLLAAVRERERRRAYARGYQDRALLAMRAGRAHPPPRAWSPGDLS